MSSIDFHTKGSQVSFPPLSACSSFSKTHLSLLTIALFAIVALGRTLLLFNRQGSKRKQPTYIRPSAGSADPAKGRELAHRIAPHLLNGLLKERAGQQPGQPKNRFLVLPPLMQMLGIVYAGGPTLLTTSLSASLRTDYVAGDLLAGTKAVSKSLAQRNPSIYRSASAALVREGYTLLGHELVDEHISFQTAGKAIERANEFASEQTEGRIPVILKELNENTVLVLLTAALFEATWKTPFKPQHTDRVHFSSTGGPRFIQYMHRTFKGTAVAYRRVHQNFKEKALEPTRGEFQPPGENEYDILGLPLEGDVFMFAVRGGGKDPQKWMKKLAEEEQFSSLLSCLQEMSNQQGTHPVEVWLPSFAIDNEVDLRDMLSQDPLFSPLFQADFRGSLISPPEGESSSPIVIDKMVGLFQAEVGRKGASMAAVVATGFVPEAHCTPPPRLQCRMDGPFLCLFYDRRTEHLIAMGSVMEPSEAILDGFKSTVES